VPARLAKGADGTVLVSDSTTSTGLAWQPYGAQYYAGKNFIVNGGFDIFQRTSAPTTGVTISGGNGYSVDRWNVWNTSPSGSIVLSRQLSGLTGIQYCARFQRPSGNTSGLNFFGQPIETTNSILLAGKTVTVSFYARKGADYSDAASSLQAQLWQNTTTDVGLPTIEGGSRSTSASTTATLTASWQRFSFTGTVASTSTQLAVVFYGSTAGTAGANDYYEITGIQLEQGSTATQFSRAGGNLAGEIAICQRYYQRYAFDTINVWIGVGHAGSGSTTQFYPMVKLTGQMRVKPYSVEYSGLGWWNGGNPVNVSSVSINNANPDYAMLTANTSGLTANNVYMLASNSTTAYLAFNAEL